MKSRKEALAVLAIAGVMVTSMFMFVGSRQQTAHAAVFSMALDATSGGGVDATRTVIGTGAFSVGIDITSAPSAYKLYQWEIAFRTDGLAFLDNTVENPATNLDVCTPPQTADPGDVSPARPGETVVRAGGCTTFTTSSTFVGQTTTFDMQCLADGTFPLLLLSRQQDLPGTFMQGGSPATTLPLTLTSATITCTGTGVVFTPTPAPTAVNTPVPTNTPAATNTATPCAPNCPTATRTLPPVYTRTPTRTPTGVATAPPPAATKSTGQIPPPSGDAPAGTGGNVRSGIRLPDTGAGSGGGSRDSTAWMLMGLLGGAMAVAGTSVMIFRRRFPR